MVANEMLRIYAHALELLSQTPHQGRFAQDIVLGHTVFLF